MKTHINVYIQTLELHIFVDLLMSFANIFCLSDDIKAITNYKLAYKILQFRGECQGLGLF